MDPATKVGRRLKSYAETLTSANAQLTDDFALEEWLGFWTKTTPCTATCETWNTG